MDALRSNIKRLRSGTWNAAFCDAMETLLWKHFVLL